MAADDIDNAYLESVKDAIGRTRGMMFAVSLIASWLIASQVAYLLEWEPIRRPISFNIASMWTLSATTRMEVRVPADAVAPSDRARMAPDSATAATPDLVGRRPYGVRGMNGDSLIAVPFPVRGTFSAKALYVDAYQSFIASQWSPTDQNRAQLLHDRNLISRGVLPPNAVTRPRVTVPVVGLSLALDDVTVTGAVLLLAMMVWVFFLVVQVRSAVELCAERFGDRWDEIKRLISLQFLFLAPKSRQPHSLAYPLVYLPYIAVVFGVAVDVVYDLRWQNMTYAAIMGSVPDMWSAFVGDSGLLMSQALGLLVIRYSVMLAICLSLLLLSNLVWRVLSEISSTLRGGHPHLHSLLYWTRLLLMTACPVVMVGFWAKGRLDSVNQSIHDTGYSSGPNLLGAFWVLGGLIVIILVLWGYWRAEQKWVATISETEANGNKGAAATPTGTPPPGQK